MENLIDLSPFFKTIIASAITIASAYVISIKVWLKKYAPIALKRWSFRVLVDFIDHYFETNLRENFEAAINRELTELLDRTGAQHIGIVLCNHNGKTEFEILREIGEETVKKINTTVNTEHDTMFRTLIDDLTKRKGDALVLNKERPEHTVFFQYLNKRHKFNEIALIPIYTDSTRHKAIAIMVSFTKYRIFNKDHLGEVSITGGRIGSLSYHIAK